MQRSDRDKGVEWTSPPQIPDKKKPGIAARRLSSKDSRWINA
jgi:hypothetical protein